MHSSISSSERPAGLQRTASYERLTAADRPGVAQPVPERPVPAQPWGAISVVVLIFVVLATAAWEWRMRTFALLPGDLEDGSSYWVEERRRVDTENVAVAIVGDSRILFDTDLDRFEALTGIRPLQLALAGTNARPFLEDLAADPDFKGLLLLGLADQSYFRKEIGLNGDALERYRFESPAQRSSHVLDHELSQVFGFLDDSYRLSNLVKRLDPGVRAGTQGPYDVVWKVRTTTEWRQTALWTRIETDRRLNAHARHFWLLAAKRPPVTDEVVAMTQEVTRAAVAAIRARGGEVIFLRPPSAGALRAVEDRRLGRERGWNALLVAAGLQGLHADDDPVARELIPAELSHLSKACATVYTDAYVRGVARLTNRLQLRADAPTPLTGAYCAPRGEAAALLRELASGSVTAGR